MQARARFYSKNVYFTKPEFGYMEKKYYLCIGFENAPLLCSFPASMSQRCHRNLPLITP